MASLGLCLPAEVTMRHPAELSDGGQSYMSFVSLKTVDDPDLKTLYAYWVRQCGSRPMPCRADINPKDIVSVIPLVFIADICRPMRFRFCLVGTAICNRWHEDLTGRWLDELAFDGEREAVLEQYASVARTGIPRIDREEFVNEESRYLHYKRLLLPLSEEGQIPNMLIGIQKAIGVDGYLTTMPKRM
jgi:hypothetical protein